MELSTTLKDDNKDLMIQIDKYIKRVKQIENTLEREKQDHSETEMQIHDLKREKEALQEQLSDQKVETQRLQKNLIET